MRCEYGGKYEKLVRTQFMSYIYSVFALDLFSVVHPNNFAHKDLGSSLNYNLYNL